jgi:hypothetical protein
VIETGLKPSTIKLTTSRQHNFTATFMASLQPENYDYFATQAETRGYVGPGGLPECIVTLTGFSHNTYDCAIAGYLIDVPLGASGVVAPAQSHRAPARPNGRSR